MTGVQTCALPIYTPTRATKRRPEPSKRSGHAFVVVGRVVVSAAPKDLIVRLSLFTNTPASREAPLEIYLEALTTGRAWFEAQPKAAPVNNASQQIAEEYSAATRELC